MRVLLVVPVPPQAEGGGAIPVLLHAELQGLRQRHEVTLVTAVGDEPGEEEAVRRLRAEGEVHVVDRRRPPPGSRRRRRQVRMATAWARGRRPWRTVWYADPGFQAVIDQLGAERAFDVVAVEDSALSVFRYPAGVATVYTHHEVLRPRDFPDVTAYRAAQAERVQRERPDLVVMAGYLVHWPPPAELQGRVLNIHPALLPLHGGKGLYGEHVHAAVLAAGDRESGCTVHVVDEEYDHGPVLAQRRVPVVPGDSVESLAARVFEAECATYPEAIAAHARSLGLPRD